MLMVKAGEPVDEFIELVFPILKKGISSSMEETASLPIPTSACKSLKEKGILFIGQGFLEGKKGSSWSFHYAWRQS